MTRLASVKVIHELVADAHKDLERAARMWELLAPHKLLTPGLTGIGSVVAANPSGVGEDISQTTKARSDPTGETAVAPSDDRAVREWRPEVGDQRAMLEFLDALERIGRAAGGFQDGMLRLRRAATGLGDRLPAVMAAVNSGRAPTDGRSQEAIDRKRRGAVEAPSVCQVCSLSASQTGGPLSGGLCVGHAATWAAATMVEPGLERPGWVLRQRAASAAEDGLGVAA